MLKKEKNNNQQKKTAGSSLKATLFQVYAGVAAFLLLVASVGYFAVEGAMIQEANRASAEVQTELTRKVQYQLDRYVVPVDALAADPLTQQTLANAEGIEQRQMELAKAIGALDVMLLSAGRERSYLGEYPKLSYSELDLVHNAQKGKKSGVEFHDLKDEQAHIDVVRAVIRKDRLLGDITVGYVMARYDAKTFNNDVLQLFKSYMDKGRLELSQILSDGSTQVFMSLGAVAIKEKSKANSAELTSARWKLTYWQMPETLVIMGMGWQLAYVLSTLGVLISVALALVVFWRVADKKARASFNTVHEFLWDRLNGHWLGKDYQLSLSEYQSIFKQIQELDWASCQMASGVSAGSAGGGANDTEGEEEPDFERSYVDLLYNRDGVAVEEEDAQPQPSVLAKTAVNPQASNPGVSPTIFRAYDIRGVVGETLTADIAYDIGRAFGSEAKQFGEQTIVVGRDGRLSSPELSDALIQGLRASGRDVVDLGLVPTPLVYFATHYLSARSGIMITGSHNPTTYNGFKLVLQGTALSQDAIQKLYKRIVDGDYTSGEEGSLSTQDLMADYIARIAGDVDISRHLKVVVDCGNGAASVAAVPLLRSMGCEVVDLYCEVDGSFPHHHPDPSQPENLNHLIVAMQQHNADIGIAFDGDGDRIGVVDSDGNIIWPDRLMMYFVADLLAANPGGTIIYDVKSSRNLQATIDQLGGIGIMGATGHSLLKAKVKESHALLGGELSGHFCFNDRWFGFDDGLYTMARLLELLSRNASSSADAFSILPDSVATPELKIDMNEGQQHKFMEVLKQKAKFPGAQLTTIDGVRADFADGWGLVRASNTTPSLTLRFEADSEESLASIQGVFRTAMQMVEPRMHLPF